MNLKTAFGGISQALGKRNYRYYWIGTFVSILGFWVHKLALGWLTWELTSSPFWLGIVGFSALFPSFILAPFAGAIADKFGMRLVANYAIILSGVSAFLLGALVYLDATSIEMVCILTLVQGMALAFDLPARQGLVYYLVERENLSSAIALNTTTFHIGAFIGPALFGLVVRFMGMEWAFLINAVTFIFFFFCLNTLVLPERPSDRRSNLRITEDILEGIRYALNHPGIRSLFIIAVLPHLFIRPFIDLLPGFSADVFGKGTEGVAILAGSFGLGSLLLGICLAVRGKTDGLARVNVISVLMATLFLLGFAATNIFWFAMISVFGVGMSIIASAVANQSLIQNTVDPDKRGRVISLSTGLAVGLPAIGSLTLGALGEKFGLQAPVIVCMLIGIIYWSFAARDVMPQAPALKNIQDQFNQ